MQILGLILWLFVVFSVHSAGYVSKSSEKNKLVENSYRNILIQDTRKKVPHVIIKQKRVVLGDLHKKSTSFQGKPISLNFQKVEIRTVLQLIANFTGMNIVVSEKVKGEMTLRLDNVPWDQALAIILNANGLEQHQEGNVITVTTKIEKNNIKNSNKAVEQPLESFFIELNYAKAKDLALLFHDNNNPLLSERGNFHADSRTNTLWIQDEPRQLAFIKAYISHLDVPVKQVLIEARIVHIAKESIQDLGLRFDFAKAITEESLKTSSNDFHMDLGLSELNPARFGIALAKLGNGILLDLELSALEAEDKAEIIASPRLMTMNQQTAVIESGEEIPYQESTASGATNITFKKAVLSLKVTPQITKDNKLLLELRINQDTPSGRLVNNVPTIFTREIATNVLVNNGQTLVLGGIYKQNKDSAVYQPALGHLPSWLGTPFRKKHNQVRNEELLIFITPKIMTTA